MPATQCEPVSSPLPVAYGTGRMHDDSDVEEVHDAVAAEAMEEDAPKVRGAPRLAPSEQPRHSRTSATEEAGRMHASPPGAGATACDPYDHRVGHILLIFWILFLLFLASFSSNLFRCAGPHAP